MTVPVKVAFGEAKADTLTGNGSYAITSHRKSD